MGFPSLAITLTAEPDYPDLAFSFDISLTGKDEDVLIAGSDTAGDIGPLLDEAATIQERLEATDEPPGDEERTTLQGRMRALTADIASARETARARYGEVLSRAYCRKQYTVYGILLDFSSGAAALTTLADEGDQIPATFMQWLRSAPILALQADANRKIKNSRERFASQLATKK